MGTSVVFLVLALVLVCTPVPVVVLGASLPLVVNTWPWPAATDAAWAVLSKSAHMDGTDADADADVDVDSPSSTPGLDALVAGCTACEQLQCNGTVGFGGSPDESGETTLDAMIMNGDTFEVGAVVDLRNVKNAIGVARAVMDYTSHTIMAGESSTKFAVEMGFTFESLETPASLDMHQQWLNASCQPNYRRNVIPDPTKYCGPYKPIPKDDPHFQQHTRPQDITQHVQRPTLSQYNHDTIAMMVIGEDATAHAATSTNGARNKIPGRVGDSPVVGAGAYAESGVGACGATGDGDVMMRFLPSFAGVELMRNGATPQQAANQMITRIMNKYPSFQGAILCADVHGGHGGAAHNWLEFPFSYCVRSPDSNSTQIIVVPNINHTTTGSHRRT